MGFLLAAYKDGCGVMVGVGWLERGVELLIDMVLVAKSGLFGLLLMVVNLFLSTVLCLLA